MSVVKPTIDELLSVTDENRFLLCDIAARRACDINDMMRNQHSRAEQLADVDDIFQFLSDDEGRTPNPLSIAFDEIAPARDENGTITGPGKLSFDEATLEHSLSEDATAQKDAPADVDALVDAAFGQTSAAQDDADQATDAAE